MDNTWRSSSLSVVATALGRMRAQKNSASHCSSKKGVALVVEFSKNIGAKHDSAAHLLGRKYGGEWQGREEGSGVILLFFICRFLLALSRVGGQQPGPTFAVLLRPGVCCSAGPFFPQVCVHTPASPNGPVLRTPRS